MNNVAVYGFDTIMALFGGAIFAQGGAALAVALKTKNKKFRSQAISACSPRCWASPSPRCNGVNLRLKKPMVCACVAGGIGSAVAGLFGCAGTAFALPALTTLPVFMSRAFTLLLHLAGARLWPRPPVHAFVPIDDDVTGGRDGGRGAVRLASGLQGHSMSRACGFDRRCPPGSKSVSVTDHISIRHCLT